MLPGDKRLLSLSLGVVPLLLVVIFIFKASVFSRRVPRLGPVVVAAAVVVVRRVVVVVVTLPGPGPGPGPASDADPSEVFRLSESALPLLALPLPVARLRQFGPEAVRGQAPLAAVAAVAAPGARPSPGSPGPRAPRVPAAVRARSIRQWHTDRHCGTRYRFKNRYLREIDGGINTRSRSCFLCFL